jgi:hypothetical protein
MTLTSPRAALALLLLLAAILAGCGQSTDPAVLEQRAKFLLQTEPAEVKSVLDLREETKDAGNVAVVGRIGGLENPFQKDRASFVIIDPSVLTGDGHVCDEPDCPHCAKIKKQKELKATAVVEFLDEQGQPVRIDAQKLFGLQAGQTVVVRGRAKLNDLNNLVISADGLYVRQ